MGKKQYTQEEIDANPDLKEMQDQGFDIEGAVSEVVGEQGDPPPADPPPADTPPADPPPADTPPADTPPADTPPADTPPADTPPADTPPPTLKKEEIEKEILSEMFGGSFNSVAEVKEAKVSEQLKELGTLREKNQTLEQQASGRPLGYANEGIALFNEFVKKTGIQNYGAFNKLMNTEIDKLEDLDTMILKEVMDKPNLIGQEANLKKMFEKRYNLDDPEQVDEGQMEINKITLKSDAETARKSLTETKTGIVLPAAPETPPPGGAPLMTPEQKEVHSKGWKQVTDKLSEEWKAFPIVAEGSKDPILTFEIPTEVKQNLVKDAYDFCIENQTELNKENVADIFGIMQKDLVMVALPKIIHSVAEKVRGMTEEEYDAVYHNPSQLSNQDMPPGQQQPTTREQEIEDIYTAELEELGGGGI